MSRRDAQLDLVADRLQELKIVVLVAYSGSLGSAWSKELLPWLD